MAKYEIEWTQELWFRITVEAENEQEAIDKWSAGDYDGYDTLEHYGMDIQDGVDITKLED